jgi:hypothetical protein
VVGFARNVQTKGIVIPNSSVTIATLLWERIVVLNAVTRLQQQTACFVMVTHPNNYLLSLQRNRGVGVWLRKQASTPRRNWKYSTKLKPRRKQLRSLVVSLVAVQANQAGEVLATHVQLRKVNNV